MAILMTYQMKIFYPRFLKALQALPILLTSIILPIQIRWAIFLILYRNPFPGLWSLEQFQDLPSLHLRIPWHTIQLCCLMLFRLSNLGIQNHSKPI